MVLLHGQPGTGSSWEPLIRQLEREFRVIAPDRAGYGRTGLEACGLAANAELVAGLIEERGAAPATVVAHSWSGAVAVLLALRRPELVGSLVLLGAACTPDSLTTLDRWLVAPYLGTAMAAVGVAGIGTVLPAIRSFVPLAPRRLQPYLATALPDGEVSGVAWGELRRTVRSFTVEQRALHCEMPAVTAALGQLGLPVEVVSGQWDLVVPPRSATTLTEAVPDAVHTVINGAGHFVARDDPATVARIVRTAVGRTSSGKNPSERLS